MNPKRFLADVVLVTAVGIPVISLVEHYWHPHFLVLLAASTAISLPICLAVGLLVLDRTVGRHTEAPSAERMETDER